MATGIQSSSSGHIQRLTRLPRVITFSVGSLYETCKVLKKTTKLENQKKKETSDLTDHSEIEIEDMMLKQK